MKYDIIRIILSDRSETEKTKLILSYVLAEDIYPAVLVKLIAEYWGYPECVSKIIPSLICPASNELYQTPNVCANDTKDWVVCERKVFDKYQVPCTPIPLVIDLIKFLRENECEFKLPPREQKADLKMGLNKEDKNRNFLQLINDGAGLYQINLFSEIKYQIEKSAGQPLDLAKVLQNFPFPLMKKKINPHDGPASLFFEVWKKQLLYLTCYYTHSLNMAWSLRNPWTIPFAFGSMINKVLKMGAAIEYTKNAEYQFAATPKCIRNLATFSSGIRELLYAYTMSKFMQNFNSVSKLFLVVSIPSFFGNTMESLACIDIYFRENSIRSYSHASKIFLCISLSNALLSLYELMTTKSDNDFFQIALQLSILLNFILSLPRYYLSSRQTAHECEELFKRPKSLLEPAHDESGFRKSSFTSLTHRTARLSAGIFLGILRYLDHHDPIQGLLAGIATLNESSIQNVFRWTPGMFRRFPSEIYPRVEKAPILESKEEEPDFEVPSSVI